MQAGHEVAAQEQRDWSPPLAEPTLCRPGLSPRSASTDSSLTWLGPEQKSGSHCDVISSRRSNGPLYPSNKRQQEDVRTRK